jgi:DNA-binding transcriptional MerR regulator
MDSPRASLTIGQLAKQSGVGVETLRYYERQRLIPEPPRRRSGYRQYPPETVKRIRFIRRAKELGFSLKEIDELLTLRAESVGQCAEVLARAQGKIADISRRSAGSTVAVDEIHEIPSFKKGGRGLACYCFGHLEAKIVEEVNAAGTSATVASVEEIRGP